MVATLTAGASACVCAILALRAAPDNAPPWTVAPQSKIVTPAVLSHIEDHNASIARGRPESSPRADSSEATPEQEARIMLDAAGYRDALIRPGPSHGALLITGPFERGPGLARLNRALARIAGLRVWVLARQASDGGLASRTVAKHLLAAVYGGGPAHAPVAAQDATGGRSARPACAALVAAVASVESGGRQFAADGGVLRSSRGALGIMQLMPKTAMAFGVDARDASANLLGGRAYLAWLSNHYGGAWDKAVVAYNWGPGHLDRALKVYGVDWWAHVPLETRTYLNLVTEKLEFLDKNR